MKYIMKNEPGEVSPESLAQGFVHFNKKELLILPSYV